MRLWFFSSGDAASNADADERLFGQIHESMGKRKRSPTVTFIPADTEDAPYYVGEFVDRISRFGAADVNVLTLGQGPLASKTAATALRSDMIYMSGGNTFQLLHSLRETGFEHDLHRYVAGGGILAGHSAGAIVMTPTITTASFPEEDCDENLVGMTNFKSMRLVPFEIYPHYSVNFRYNVALQKSSLRMGRPIYGLPDGSCIAVDGEALTFVGPVWAFVKGIRFKVQ
jgi:dipeptidase E